MNAGTTPAAGARDRPEFERGGDGPAWDTYRSIFENAVVGIYQTTVDGRYLRVNQALAVMYGYDSPAALIDALTDIAGQLYVDNGRRSDFQTLMAAQDVVHEFEAEIFRRDGRRIWIKENARCVRDRDGAILYYEGMVTDVTARKLVEQRNRLLVSVFESVAEGIVVIDRNAVVRTVNPAYLLLTGWTEAELVDHVFEMPGTGRQQSDFIAQVCRDAASQGRWEGETICLRRPATPFPAFLSVSTVHNPDGDIEYYILVFTDITRRKQDEERIRYHANFDTLTGLPNRRLLRDRLEQAMLHALQNRTKLAVAFLDLDRFKQINDTLGHKAGDELLKLVAKRLRNCTRLSDTVGRFGGDEFVVVAAGCADRSGASYLAEKIVYSFSEPFQLAEREIFCFPSIGIAMYPDDGDNAEELIRAADVAMYQAKKSRASQFCFYNRDMLQLSERRLDLENDMRRALARNEFVLFYQPKVSLITGGITGAEALIRWNHPTLGLVSPGQFISVAEETGLIHDIGLWTLREACRQLQEWHQQGLPIDQISVNLSPIQFQDRKIVTLVGRVLAEFALRPDCLELELTESAMTVDIDRAVATLNALKRLGVRISIDDFGTGYSSLSYLKRFPIDTVKIDRSFVRDLDNSTTDPQIVEAIIALARSLGFGVVAEGVERREQAMILRERECPQMQGFLISKPLDSEIFREYLKQFKPRSVVGDAEG